MSENTKVLPYRCRSQKPGIATVLTISVPGEYPAATPLVPIQLLLYEYYPTSQALFLISGDTHSTQVSGGKGYLQIIAPCKGIHINDFTGEIQSADPF